MYLIIRAVSVLHPGARQLSQENSTTSGLVHLHQQHLALLVMVCKKSNVNIKASKLKIVSFSQLYFSCGTLALI